jgi:hypothetical protein
MSPEDRPSEPDRQVYMVLSPRSLPYALFSIESLLRNSFQALHLHLITDSHEDKLQLIETMESLQPDVRHCWEVTAEAEMLDREATTFREFDNLRTFRGGHPCWRKITDPLLLSEPGRELILLDPDLYFPNLFQFETTPQTGLLLMWQRPNCLLPPEIVRRAMEEGIPLADHVDIGVAHWRAGQDLQWVDWLIGKLGGASLPRAMHIEAIVWAAVAMHGGGGHLDPMRWVCWHRTQLNRVKRKLGVSGVDILRTEPWDEMKCFHCGGEAKWWLPDFCSTGLLPSRTDRLQPCRTLPFVEFTPAKFARDQKAKGILRALGYYKLLGSY